MYFRIFCMYFFHRLFFVFWKLFSYRIEGLLFYWLLWKKLLIYLINGIIKRKILSLVHQIVSISKCENSGGILMVWILVMKSAKMESFWEYDLSSKIICEIDWHWLHHLQPKTMHIWKNIIFLFKELFYIDWKKAILSLIKYTV